MTKPRTATSTSEHSAGSRAQHLAPGLVMGLAPGLAMGLACVMGVFQLVNAVRALVDPVGFSGYMGFPIGVGDPAEFVWVYGLRSLFIGLVVILFVIRRNVPALLVMAVCALILPLGDAALAWRAGAPGATVLRHMLIAAYLLVAVGALQRAKRGGVAS